MVQIALPMKPSSRCRMPAARSFHRSGSRTGIASSKRTLGLLAWRVGKRRSARYTTAATSTRSATASSIGAGPSGPCTVSQSSAPTGIFTVRDPKTSRRPLAVQTATFRARVTTAAPR
jgi:hypothetical protein